MPWLREKALSEVDHYTNAKTGRFAATRFPLLYPKESHTIGFREDISSEPIGRDAYPVFFAWQGFIFHCSKIVTEFSVHPYKGYNQCNQ